jgi:hypothetical protein
MEGRALVTLHIVTGIVCQCSLPKNARNQPVSVLCSSKMPGVVLLWVAMALITHTYAVLQSSNNVIPLGLSNTSATTRTLPLLGSRITHSLAQEVLGENGSRKCG